MANLVIKNNNTTGTESSINLKATNVDWKISGDKDNLKILKNGTQIAEIAATGFDATLTQVDQAAQAKAVGDKISTLESSSTTLTNAIDTINQKLNTIDTGANKYILPAATASALGGVKIGSNISNSSGTISLSKANVVAALGYTPPETDTNTTYTEATNTTYGLVKIGYQENGKNYPVELSNGKMYVNVPWTDNNTTYENMGGATSNAAGRAGLVPAPAAGKQGTFLRGDGTWAIPTNTTYSKATSDTFGLVKIGYSGFTTTNQNYPVVLDADGKMYVNVPWTDTTYTVETLGAAPADHEHTAGDITSGIIQLARGGTGSAQLVDAPNNAIIYRLKNNTSDQLWYKATASGAFYATSANGAAQFGTLPIAQGGTGATTAAGILTNLGISATAAELNYVDGVTSSIQTQLNTISGNIKITSAAAPLTINSSTKQISIGNWDLGTWS